MSTTKPAAATAVNVTLLLWSCIVAANFFNTDASVVGMIAPTLITGEGASSSLVSLTSAIFTLMVAAFLLGGAALGDIYGRKRVMLIGIVGETVMAVLAWITPSVTLLLPIRLVAGIFAALISPHGASAGDGQLRRRASPHQGDWPLRGGLRRHRLARLGRDPGPQPDHRGGASRLP
jgi:MFS family permease